MQLKAPTLELPLSTFTSQSLCVNAPAGFPQRNLERAFWLGSAGTTLMAFCCWPWTRIFPIYVIPENLQKISTPPVATVTHIWTVTSPRNPLFLAKQLSPVSLIFLFFTLSKTIHQLWITDRELKSLNLSAFSFPLNVVASLKWAIIHRRHSRRQQINNKLCHMF